MVLGIQRGVQGSARGVCPTPPSAQGWPKGKLQLKHREAGVPSWWLHWKVKWKAPGSILLLGQWPGQDRSRKDGHPQSGEECGAKEPPNASRGYCGALEVWHPKAEGKMVTPGFICLLGVGAKGPPAELVVSPSWKGQHWVSVTSSPTSCDLSDGDDPRCS